MRPIAVLLALATLCHSAPTQQPGQQPGTRDPGAPPEAPPTRIQVGSSGFVLPKGDVELGELIEAAAYYLQRNILWQPNEIQNAGGPPLHFQKELALDALGCEEVLSKLLYVRGFALVTVDADRGVYQVIHRQGQRRTEIVESAQQRSAEEILRRPNLKQYVLTEVRLEYTDAMRAMPALRQFFGQTQHGGAHFGITLGTMGGPHSMLLGGFQDEVARAIRLIHACDQQAQASPDVHRRLETLETRVRRLTKKGADGTAAAGAKSGSN